MSERIPGAGLLQINVLCLFVSLMAIQMQKNPGQTTVYSRDIEDERTFKSDLAESIFDLFILRTGIFLEMQFLQNLKNHKKEPQEVSF